jgi:hypothetical protein
MYSTNYFYCSEIMKITRSKYFKFRFDCSQKKNSLAFTMKLSFNYLQQKGVDQKSQTVTTFTICHCVCERKTKRKNSHKVHNNKIS